MKLKTTMIETTCGTLYADSQDGSDVDHDAAAAHALLRSIEDFTDKIYSSYARGLIEKRADELLRSWGFDSGEVE